MPSVRQNIISSIDATSGYWQIPLAEESRKQNSLSDNVKEMEIQMFANGNYKCSSNFPKKYGIDVRWAVVEVLCSVH